MTNEELDRLETLAKAASVSRDRVTAVSAASPDVVLRLVADLREARASRDCLAGELASIAESLGCDRTSVAAIDRIAALHRACGETVARVEKIAAGMWIPCPRCGRTGIVPGRNEYEVDRCPDCDHGMIAPSERSAAAELAEARAEIERRKAGFDALHANRDRHASMVQQLRTHHGSCEEVARLEAEVERLRAMVPSEHVILGIRAMIAGTSLHVDEGRAAEWLARIESAKEAGR